MKKRLIALIMIMVVVIPCINVWAVNTEDATPDDTGRVIMYTDPVPAEATAAALEVFESYMRVVNDSQAGFGVELNDAPITLGQGFYSYYDTGTEQVVSDIVWFPIVQNNEIILFLAVTYSNGKWLPCLSGDMVDIFNEKLQNRTSVDDIGIICDSISAESDPEDAIHFMNSDENVSLYTTGVYTVSIMDTLAECSVDVSQSAATYSGGPGGFSQNEPGYKLLEMSYCLMDQNGPDGTQKPLCWAASIAAIVRYRTGDRSNNTIPYQIANRYDLLYVGQYLNTVTNIINQELAGSGSSWYYSRYRPANSATEIYHNINNQYPFYSVWRRRNNDLEEIVSTHGMAIIGYNIIGTAAHIIMWDSEVCQLRITAFDGANTRASLKWGSYTWEESALIPYE